MAWITFVSIVYLIDVEIFIENSLLVLVNYYKTPIKHTQSPKQN